MHQSTSKTQILKSVHLNKTGLTLSDRRAAVLNSEPRCVFPAVLQKSRVCGSLMCSHANTARAAPGHARATEARGAPTWRIKHKTCQTWSTASRKDRKKNDNTRQRCDVLMTRLQQQQKRHQGDSKETKKVCK